MILNLFVLLFVIGITFMHSLFGLYSGILNVFCCIVAVAVTFGFGEALTFWATGQFGLHPAYTEAVAYLLLFAVTHGGLRFLADTFLRGNVRVPMLADWIGGAVAGVIIAQLSIGMLLICFLMLPWGGRIMMYQPIERNREEEQRGEERRPGERARIDRNRIWLRSDDFTAGLGKFLSGGSLRGETTVAAVYPNFTEWLAWTGNTVQPESTPAPYRDPKTGDGFKDGITVESWWTQSTPLSSAYTRYRNLAPSEDRPTPAFAPFEYRPEAGHHLLGVRLTLRPAAGDRDRTAIHLFRPTMIRLVGDVVQSEDLRFPRQFAPVVLGGVNPPALADNLRVVDFDNNLSLPATAKIDAYFEVPTDFVPRFVEYRRHARAAVVADHQAKTPPGTRLAAGESAPETPTGATNLRDVLDYALTGPEHRLPFPLAMDRARAASQIEVSGNALVRGRLTGDMSAWSPPGTLTDGNVSVLRIPDGMCIMQFRLNLQQARSLPGQIMNFVTGTTNQYYAADDVGELYPLAGYYAVVTRNNDQYFELFFEPNPLDAGYNQMLNFSDTGLMRQLQNDNTAVLGLIFVIPKGVNIVALNSRQRDGRIELGNIFTSLCQ
ncbi:MAG: CvpA family protein [Phycisphaerales bacterium]|nr:CvpA family protein [Phycisphaerales bacterium]